MARGFWKKLGKRALNGFARAAGGMGGGPYGSVINALQNGYDAGADYMANRSVNKKRKSSVNSYPITQRDVKRMKKVYSDYHPESVTKNSSKSNMPPSANRLSKNLKFGKKPKHSKPSKKFIEKVFETIQPPIKYEICNPIQDYVGADSAGWVTCGFGFPGDYAACVSAFKNSGNVFVSSSKLSQKIFCDYAHYEVEIINCQLTIANIRIYHCHPRRDVPTACVGQTTITGLVQNGFADQALLSSTGGVIMPTYNPETTLYDNPEFTRLFKIESCKRFQMNPGESMRIEDGTRGPFIIDSVYAGNSTDYLATKRTHFFIIQHWGQVGADSTNPNGTGIGFVPSKLDMIEKKYFMLKGSAYGANQSQFVSNLGTLAGATQVISDLTGAVVSGSTNI